jgi:hypothetical protein
MGHDYQVGDLLIRLSNQEAVIITAIRETPRTEYGAAAQKRKEYQLYGRVYLIRHRRREHRWVSDTEIRTQYDRP